MAFWNDLGDKIADTGGITSSFGALTGAKDLKGVISGLAGVAGSINDYFNKGKEVQYPTFDLSKFRSSFVNEKDGTVARNNLFDVMVIPPAGLSTTDKRSTGGAEMIQSVLCKRIESTSLPSKRLETSNISMYGPVRKMVTGTQYNEISVTMIMSEGMSERRFITDWMEAIQPTLGSVHDGDISYYNEYIGKVEIRVYDQDGGTERLRVNLVEAYPVSIEEVPLSWSDNNSYMKVRVGFMYRHFYEEYKEKGAPPKDDSLLGMLRGFRDDVRGMITDLRNLRFNFKTVKSNLKDLRRTLDKDLNSNDPLSKIEAIAGAPAAIAGAISDSAFKLLDRSSSGSVGSVLDKASSNASKYFSF